MDLHVVVATFKDVVAAQEGITAVRDAGITLVDEAYVSNGGDGDISFSEGRDAGGGEGLAAGDANVTIAGMLLGPVGWGALAAGGIGGGLVARLHAAGIPEADLERLGASLEPGHAAAIAVAHEGDEDRVQEILVDNGGEVVRVSVTDDLRTALEGDAPTGVAATEDGSAGKNPSTE